MRSNRMLKFALAASLVLNLTVLSTVGFLYYQKSSSWVSPFGTVMKRDRFLFEELSLRPEQRQALRERAIPFRAEIDRQRQEIGLKKKALLALMRTGNPSPDTVAAAVAEIGGMQERMQHTIVMHMLEMKGMLGREQQEKFLDLIEKAMTEGGQPGCTP